jgi:hypothetical protein
MRNVYIIEVEEDEDIVGYTYNKEDAETFCDQQNEESDTSHFSFYAILEIVV